MQVGHLVNMAEDLIPGVDTGLRLGALGCRPRPSSRCRFETWGTWLKTYVQ